jgi:hypothetical protein
VARILVQRPGSIKQTTRVEQLLEISVRSYQPQVEKIKILEVPVGLNPPKRSSIWLKS